MSDTLWAVVVGALAAGVPTILVAVVQERQKTRRELVKLATECALADMKLQFDNGVPGKEVIAPLFTFVYHHNEVLKRLEKGKLKAADLDSINREVEELIKHLAK